MPDKPAMRPSQGWHTRKRRRGERICEASAAPLPLELTCGQRPAPHFLARKKVHGVGRQRFGGAHDRRIDAHPPRVAPEHRDHRRVGEAALGMRRSEPTARLHSRRSTSDAARPRSREERRGAPRPSARRRRPTGIVRHRGPDRRSRRTVRRRLRYAARAEDGRRPSRRRPLPPRELKNTTRRSFLSEPPPLRKSTKALGVSVSMMPSATITSGQCPPHSRAASGARWKLIASPWSSAAAGSNAGPGKRKRRGEECKPRQTPGAGGR